MSLIRYRAKPPFQGGGFNRRHLAWRMEGGDFLYYSPFRVRRYIIVDLRNQIKQTQQTRDHQLTKSVLLRFLLSNSTTSKTENDMQRSGSLISRG